jgi:hypothetical protein
MFNLRLLNDPLSNLLVTRMIIGRHFNDEEGVDDDHDKMEHFQYLLSNK